MRLVNLTPHRIVIRAPRDGVVIDIVVEPSLDVARVGTRVTDAGRCFVEGIGITCETKEYMDVEGLPSQSDWPGTVYLVSGIVLSALKERKVMRGDVAAPATGPNDGAVRDASGQVVAVTKLNVLC